MPRRRPESRRCPAAGGRYPRPAASLRAALQARGTAGRRKEGAGGRSPAASGSRRRAAGFGGRRGHAARTGGAGSVCCPRAGRGSATLSPATVRACLQAAAAPPGCCCCCCQTHFLAPSLCVGRGPTLLVVQLQEQVLSVHVAASTMGKGLSPGRCFGSLLVTAMTLPEEGPRVSHQPANKNATVPPSVLQANKLCPGLNLSCPC
ncbi:uncharacterized protein LOC120506059 isoform X2 [Passer montanus]|uniref:uncharacterized protein LOC120506059 isoform X2 n=1 Tax=Passer montanus TaxID=9160 RepID=UPI001960DBC3|nr:uncharacterized protein LOC120506059 isoform X2 [Passer montanus]